MTYDTEKAKVYREPVTIIEIDQDYCTRTYGSAPCVAAIGVTGSDRCFNTRKTCQDSANYDGSTNLRTYRFIDRPLNVAAVLPYYPTLLSVSLAPAKLNPGRGLGTRASITITLQDHPDGDSGVDKYVKLRAYSPQSRGTFWSKWLARNPYYQGRKLRVRTGYLTDPFDLANFESRLYYIEQIEGPDRSGKVRITAKDVFKLLDDERAQAPVANTGKLLADITNVATSATLTPTGIGNDEYAASGTIAIGREVMTFTRAGDALTLTRATDGTTAATHSAGDVVQQCLRYTNAKIQDIVNDLLTVYGRVPASYITIADWNAEADVWMSAYRFSALIPKPNGVNSLLTELCEQGMMYIWPDERVPSVEFRCIRPALDDEITVLNEDAHIVADSFEVTERPSERVSEVWVLYGAVDPTEAKDDVNNYKRRLIAYDSEAAGPTKYGEDRIRKVFCRWIPADSNGDALALVLGSRLLAKYKENPRVVHLQLDAKDSDLWTGEIARITSRKLSDFTGAAVATEMQVVEVRESKRGLRYAYELVRAFFDGRYGFITENSMVDYALATEDQRRVNGFISPNSGVFSDGTTAYKVI